ncbi:MAG: hypothetical protein S4CHLAM7_02290 [Chlamydiae bacterium]|nr:hypothetical protein [Chlamydiota bacterium]
MSTYISSLNSYLSETYISAYKHVQEHKKEYLASAVVLATSFIAYSYFNGNGLFSFNKVPKDRMDSWCKAYYFDGSKKVEYIDTKNLNDVDNYFVKIAKAGNINDICTGPNPGIWDTKEKVLFSNPETNIVPSFLAFPTSKLTALKILEENNLIATKPGTEASQALLYQVANPASLVYLLKKRSGWFFGKSFNLNQENSQGLTPFTHAISIRKSLKRELIPMLNLMIRSGANINYQSSQGSTPLGIALQGYSKESSKLSDDVNTKLTDLVGYLLRKGATLKIEDFYKISEVRGQKTFKDVDSIYMAIRRLSLSDSRILDRLVKNGLDLRALTPGSSSYALKAGETKEQALTKPLLYQFIQHFGMDDLYFQDTENKKISLANLKICLKILTDPFSKNELKNLKIKNFKGLFDAFSNKPPKERTLLNFVKIHDKTKDKILIKFFEKLLA